jgi:hypothetical protein
MTWVIALMGFYSSLKYLHFKFHKNLLKRTLFFTNVSCTTILYVSLFQINTFF